MAIFSNNVSIANDGELIGGGVEWQSVKTASFTAVANEGYFVNTTSAAITVTLPASPSAGDTVILKDYARTWGTNNVTLASTLLDGTTTSSTFSTAGQTVTLVYMDGVKGWSLINEDTTSNLGPLYVTATGGTITTSSDYKIHTFTGDGCFVVSCAGNPTGSTSVDYLVVAGGGGGGIGFYGGGGGAGGFRESSGTASGCYSVSPLGACVAALPVSVTTYPITVGGGAAGSTSLGCAADARGSNSVFSTITSTGGGGGGNRCTGCAQPGGSGGGKGDNYAGSGGSGNTPPVSPPQGNPGSNSPYPSTANYGGSGGGATAAGTGGNPGGPPYGGAVGGAGATTSISGSPTSYAGGGGGGREYSCGSYPGAGGIGGGGTSGRFSPSLASSAGTANTGGGGGGGGGNAAAGAAGGKGIVILRYKFQ